MLATERVPRSQTRSWHVNFNNRNPETTDAAGAHKRLLYPVPVHKHRGEPDKLTNHKNRFKPPSGEPDT
jgi:hypothetical protein